MCNYFNTTVLAEICVKMHFCFKTTILAEIYIKMHYFYWKIAKIAHRWRQSPPQTPDGFWRPANPPLRNPGYATAFITYSQYTEGISSFTFIVFSYSGMKPEKLQNPPGLEAESPDPQWPLAALPTSPLRNSGYATACITYSQYTEGISSSLSWSAVTHAWNLKADQSWSI